MPRPRTTLYIATGQLAPDNDHHPRPARIWRMAMLIVTALFMALTTSQPAGAQGRAGKTAVKSTGWTGTAVARAGDAVFCASDKACTVVGTHGNFMSYNGAGWKAGASTPFPSPQGWAQVSCPTSTFCLAVDPEGRTYDYNGLAWEPAGKQSLGYSATLSCASPAFCAVITSSGASWAYANGSWISMPDLPGYYPGNGQISGYWAPAVSCTSPAFCEVVEINQSVTRAYTYNGSSWQAQVIDHGKNGLQASMYAQRYWVGISCTSPAFCEAVQSNGDVITYESGQWGPPHRVLFGLEHPVFVECPDPGDCVATSSAATFVLRRGVWSKMPGPPLNGGSLSSLSCPAPGFCAATTSSSAVHFYTYAAPRAKPVPKGPGETTTTASSTTSSVAAGFSGTYKVVYTVTSISGSYGYGLSVGSTSTASWSATPTCQAGQCSVAIVASSGTRYEMTAVGGELKGIGSGTITCMDTSAGQPSGVTGTSQLSIALTPGQGSPISTLQGTESLTMPAGTCPGSGAGGATFNLDLTRVGP